MNDSPLPDMTVLSEAEMIALGQRIAAALRPGDAVALRGSLGSGKTTLTRGILQALGLESEAPSPSFAIVQPYDLPEVSLPLAHVDLYRLEDEADLKDGKISVQSPVGRALIGKRVGELVEVTTPARVVEYEVLEIRFEDA